MIEQAYTLGEALGVAVWCEDEAGPYGTVPYLGQSWQPEGQPELLPHEYFREGTAKMITLLTSVLDKKRWETSSEVRYSFGCQNLEN